MMKNHLIDVLINVVEKRVSPMEFRNIFYNNYVDFEHLFTTSDSEKDTILFNQLNDAIFNDQAEQILSICSHYVKEHSIPIPIHEEKVKHIEQKLGYLLPKDFIDFLKAHTSFYLENSYVFPISNPIPETLQYYVEDGYWELHAVFQLLYNPQDSDGILNAKETALAWELPDNFIPISGDGHTWVGFSYSSKKATPKVVFMASDDKNTILLADSFSEFAKQLIPYQKVYNEDGELIAPNKSTP